jgi:hypothetical protein
MSPTVRWSARGSCGNSGCTDLECCCSVCHRPIGISEDDPRWDSHDDYCDGCELCRDSVPIILFRGEGEATEQAQFHEHCFDKVVEFLSTAEPLGRENLSLPPTPGGTK